MYKSRFQSLLIALVLTWSVVVKAQNDSVSLESINPSLHLADFKWVHNGGWNHLYEIDAHPSFDDMRTEVVTDSLLALINSRKENIGDTLSTSKFFYCWKPYFEWLKAIDAHYTVAPFITYDIDFNADDYWQIVKKYNNNFNDKARFLPINVLNINDTLYVEQSLDKRLQYGDIVVSVNGIKTEDILRCAYSYRHSPLYYLMLYHSHASIVDEYDVHIERNGIPFTYTIQGVRLNDMIYELAVENAIEKNIKHFGNEIGYIKIGEFFPDNSRLIRILSNGINGFKKDGITDVILDLRENNGGNGNQFDLLLSILIDKPEIKYCKSRVLKVSKETLNDYDFVNEEMLGTNVEIPASEYPYTIPLNRKKFVEGMKYYILMDEGTFSMAATFCNIMQYNGAAILVGEPLLKNAFKYGETIEDGKKFCPRGKETRNTLPFYAALVETGISTSVTDECTNATHGTLMPDIIIPYKTDSLSKGKDNILEELIGIIKRES